VSKTSPDVPSHSPPTYRVSVPAAPIDAERGIERSLLHVARNLLDAFGNGPAVLAWSETVLRIRRSRVPWTRSLGFPIPLWRSSKVTRGCLPRLPTKTERSELTHSFAGFKRDSLGSVTDLSLRVIPIGHQVLLVESLDEIRTNFFIEQSPEQQIGPVDHIDHKRLHLLIAKTREF